MAAAHPEALLISAVLRTGDYQALAAHGITSDLFTAYPDEMVWVERYIQRRGKAPNKATFLAQFPDFTIYKVDDTEHFSQEVKQEYKRTTLTNMMQQALYQMDDDPDRTIMEMHANLLNVQARAGTDKGYFDLFEDWQEVYSNVASRVDRVVRTGMAGVPTGFATLDGITGGLQPGWLAIVAARLSQGKTWTCVRMGWAAALAQYRVAYFSLEQSRHQIGMRVHSFASSVHGQEVYNSLDLSRGHGFDLRSYKKFLSGLKDLMGNGRFVVNDSSRGTVTPATIAACIENQQPHVVYIDYLTLMGMTGDDWRATARLSAELQGVSQRYGVPIAAASQVNRLGIGKEPPGAEHLSQADAIGQDADVVLTMLQKSKSVMKMKLAKFRHGPSGVMWYCRFSPGTGQFDEISGDDADVLIEKDHEVE